MTPEEKKLLLKDLCARLPYGVIVNYKEGEYDFHKWTIETLDAPAYSKSGSMIDTDHDGWIGYTYYEGTGMSSGSRPLHLDKMLPYLRLMISMTEEEEIYYNTIYTTLKFYEKEDWLNAHHFDYRGLIPMGLAIEAPTNLYEK